MEATEWLNRLEMSIAADIALRHEDSLIELETFFRDLLNLVFGWNLQNANTLLGGSQDSFDLSDDAASLAVQVTATTTAEKIRKTIESFVGTHDTTYRRLVFVYPRVTLPNTRANFSDSLNGFDFDADRDRLGFGSVLKEAQGFTIDKLECLIQLLRKELRPLGAALQIADRSASELSAKYAKWVHQTSSTFFVPGLSVTMPIEDAWVRLKVMKDDKLIVGTKSSLDEQFQNYLEFGQRIRAAASDSVASDSLPLTHSRTVLVGGPGDGKSTMLKRFAWRLSSDGAIVVRVRLPIVLRTMLAGRTFEEAVRLFGFDGSGIPDNGAIQLLDSADYLLCDGLDECDPHRAHIAEQIIRWSVGHNDCRICVATRPVGHEAAFLPGFSHFALQPPEDHDVQELSRKLFQTAGHDDTWFLKWADFVKSIDSEKSKREAPHIRVLASRNPLLLGFLIRLTLDGIDIGKTRSGLYAQILEIIGSNTPNDREAVTINERVATEVANSLAWKQTLTPFCSSQESLDFVSGHLQHQFNLDLLQADSYAKAGLQYWQNRRLVEIVSSGNDSRIFFIHLSLQEFCAARYARDLKSPKFTDWIRQVRRQPSWKQVILLLAGLEDDSRTISALLALDGPHDPVSCDGLLAAAAFFERNPPDLAVLPRLLDSLAKRFESEIPLVAIEAAKHLARLAPYAKQALKDISRQKALDAPWSKLGSLLLRMHVDDSRETIDEFKEWFKNRKAISVHVPTIGSPNDSQELPEEARDLQNQTIELGVERMIASHDKNEIAEYFAKVGELGNVSAGLLSTIQQRLIDIGLPETAKALWRHSFDTSMFQGMESAARRSRKGEANLLKLIALASRATKKSENEPPFLVLSVLVSALQYWGSTSRAMATLEDLEPNDDEAGVEVIRALTAALKLDPLLLGGEALAALEFCTKHESQLYNAIEHAAAAAPDWTVLTPDRFNPKLIAQGLLHQFSLISRAAAEAIYSGFATSDAASVIPGAFEAYSEHVIWYAAAIAQGCMGEKAMEATLSRLERAISVDHKCLFREIARHCGEKRRRSAVDCFLSWLKVENSELAASIAEYLAEFSPPLGADAVESLRELLVRWTEYSTKCDHGIIVKGGGMCPKCIIVPRSPRSFILKELIRLNAISFDELIRLCGDSRSDVADVAKSAVVERAAASVERFSDVLERVETNQLSPRVLDKLLKLPIEQGSPIAKKAERLLHASDLQLRLATIGQLSGKWIDRAAAIVYLRICLGDKEPTIRTLATRVLRLLEVT